MVYDYDEFYHYHDGNKEAHMFGEWEIVVQDDTVIVYIPRFNENKIVYTANFYDSDKTLIESIKYYYGEDFKKPSDPIKEGYEFTGWKLESSGGAGGSDSVKAYYAEDLPLASAPPKVGYTFDGYYGSLDNMYYDSLMVGVKKYDLNTDLTLTAKWRSKTYTVNIECGEYTYLYDTTYTVQYGKGYNFNQVETSENFKFKGRQYEEKLITNSNGYIPYCE